MPKEKTPLVIITLFAVIVGLQVYWLFFESKSATVTSTPKTATASPTTFESSRELSVQDLATGVLRLQNDRYYPLTGEQKKKFLTLFEDHRILWEKLDGCTEKLQKVLTADQMDYIRQNRSSVKKPGVKFDSTSAMGVERQILKYGLQRIEGRSTEQASSREEEKKNEK